MNVNIDIINCSGIFAKHIFALKSLKNSIGDANKVDNLYFDILGYNGENPFNYVLEQKRDDNGINIDGILYLTYKDLFNNSELKELQRFVKKINIKEDILKQINPKIDEETIGIHIRLTDMNVFHAKDHGYTSFDDFRKKLNEVIKIEGKRKIFVASDNIESIEKLKKDYDVIYNEKIVNRHLKEDDSEKKYNEFLRKNHFNKKQWEESYLEMLSLSRCGYLISRVSSLNNISMMFSSTIKKVYQL